MKCYFFVIIITVLLIGCSDVIEVTDISKENVQLLAPADSIATTQTDLNFSWNVLEDAESYRIQIAQPAFDDPVQVVLDSITTESNIDVTLTPNDYNWRVKALNSAYETEYTRRSLKISE